MAITTGDTVESAAIVTVKGQGTTSTTAAVEMNPNPDHAEQGQQNRDAGTTSGATRVGAYCRDVWFSTYGETDDDNHIYDCWEKFRGDKVKNEYVYNRYSTFTQAKPPWALKHEIVDATIRYRPWKTKGNIRAGPLRTVPVPSENCTQQSFGIGISHGSISFPAMLCTSQVQVISKNKDHSTAVIWTGATKGQIKLDGASMFLTTGSELVMSDYLYFQTRSCIDIPGPCAGGDVTPGLWTDGGWS